MQWAHREWRRFALLPSEPLRRYDVEGQIDDVKWPPGIACGGARIAAAPLPKLVHAWIVALVKSGEWIGLALPRCAEERAHEPAAEQCMQREAVDVDEQRCRQCQKSAT